MLLTQWLLVAIFASTLIGLVCWPNKPERVFASTTLVCLAASFVSSEEILINAVNPGLVTLLLLVLCSFAYERTSILRRLSALMLHGKARSASVRTLVFTALSSAIISNTAVVATLISVVKKNTVINPGRLLLPLSFAAILGGTLTLIGTSTNLIVNSLWLEQGQVSLGFFDFTLVGGAALVTCLIIILLRQNTLAKTENQRLAVDQYLLEAEVKAQSKLVGKSIEENGLRNLDALFLAELVRDGRLISPVTPDEIIHANDRLIFTGDISKVLILQQFDGLVLFAEQDGLLRDNLTEVLIKPDSAIVGETLKSAGFRARFDAAVVAVRREGASLSGKLGDIKIQAGDFLVLAVGSDFCARTNLSKNFYILSGHTPDNMLSGWRDGLAIFGFIIAIAISMLSSISLLSSLLFYLALLMFSGCLSVNEIKRRFPIEIWLIVLGALTLAQAFENSGVAAIFAGEIEHALAGQSAILALVVIFFITLLLTEVITNSAAAALAFPVAYNIAIGLGVSPLPLVMAVVFGASGSFISPYGYQTNIMVFNAGNYKIADFIKFGWPVTVAYSVVVLTMIPWVFPF
ncbi:Di-and tricarboxylate transporter [Colwellia chukchiensis]|uniref:Di-and tricarboxylate transporter n=1 Tax=Colwellia chukchiensis TaxID=641665 RepID=A0A1H7H6Z5_9GAMM|nr:SLC13 family permease [Colwellia chukchiensis]SEK46008.1 Di-and tricarboxylate transporter [Colwellia chukchiensis]